MKLKKTITKIAALSLAAIAGFSTMACKSGKNEGANLEYAFNHGADIKELELARLPLGSIKADGHLYERLEAQGENITYDMYEVDKALYESLIFGNGTHTGVPSAAYYIRGLAYTGYTLGEDDPAGKKCIDRTKKLLENMYAYAEKYKDDPVNSGLYVPPSAQNWIDKQEVGEALQCVYEYSGDENALKLLENYCLWLESDLKQNSMAGNWEGTRKADIFDSAVWLYNRTKDDAIKKSAVEVMRLVTEQAIDWTDIMEKNEFLNYNFYTRHIVNVTQGLKEPAEFYLLDGDQKHLDAFYSGLESLTREHGRVDGLVNGTEQLSGKSSIEGVETCAVVEMVKSLNRAFQITKDVTLADRMEKIGYNSLPASFSYDMKSISYFNPTNLVSVTKGAGAGYSNLYYDENPGYCTDADEDLGLGPHPACHCCSVNCHIGYPEFINSMYYATLDNGVMVSLYGPSSATLKVGKKSEEITIKQTTNYPYEDVVNVSFAMSDDVKFPLYMRIPEWATNMTITLNGQAVTGFEAGKTFVMDRKWSASDTLSIDFKPEITESRWANNSVGVTRGSLVFSLNIGETYTQRGVAGTTSSGKTYYDYDVKATGAWNYGLVLDKENFADNFETVINSVAVNDKTYNYYKSDNYSRIDSAPIALKVKAKKIPDWTINDINMIAEEVPVSPVVSLETTEEIYLTPYAAGKLRVANIPEISVSGDDTVTDSKAYTNDFSNKDTSDFLFYGPAYNITSKGFGTFYKINYGADVTNENDVENAWGHSAFNPKAMLDGYKFANFTLETTIVARNITP